ncbi:protein S100-Z-like [Conger conger]|uniref:protein S100-Z-like n=1 Tax=Conger conger TaxID=82655 RepID=UPI002A5A5334|nr:protein S100-Z-like [Conger conger]
MTYLEAVMTSIIDLFADYSSTGKKGQLSSGELKKCLEKELNFPALKGVLNTEDVEAIMTDLDKNHDNQLNFREFCEFVIKLTRLYRNAKKEDKKEDK